MGYTSPLEDTKFVLENLLPAHEDLDDTTIDAVLSEASDRTASIVVSSRSS